VAAETGVVMIVYIENAWRDNRRSGAGGGTRAGVGRRAAAVMHGAGSSACA